MKEPFGKHELQVSFAEAWPERMGKAKGNRRGLAFEFSVWFKDQAYRKF